MCLGCWGLWGLLPSSPGRGAAQLCSGLPALHPQGRPGKQRGISVSLFSHYPLETESSSGVLCANSLVFHRRRPPPALPSSPRPCSDLHPQSSSGGGIGHTRTPNPGSTPGGREDGLAEAFVSLLKAKADWAARPGLFLTIWWPRTVVGTYHSLLPLLLGAKRWDGFWLCHCHCVLLGKSLLLCQQEGGTQRSGMP